ncbi:MAG: pentapeptide repeat-containing protein, partial [Myxococcales bacterium]|nr:pentapeptide repeat-containing protein [Myxococcales bacterium]
ADLRETVFHRARCAKARFVAADLSYADFSGADISEVDMSGAQVFRAKLHRVVDTNAVIPGRALTLGTDPELAAAEGWEPKY